MDQGQDDIQEPASRPPGGPAEDSSRRTFLRRGMRRAAYIAPVIWSISARQALASSLEGSAFMAGSGGPGPPTPE